jgi:hypothetical protein
VNYTITFIFILSLFLYLFYIIRRIHIFKKNKSKIGDYYISDFSNYNIALFLLDLVWLLYWSISIILIILGYYKFGLTVNFVFTLIYFFTNKYFPLKKLIFGEKGIIIYGKYFFCWDDIDILKWEFDLVKENTNYPNVGILRVKLNNQEKNFHVSNTDKHNIDKLFTGKFND